MHWGHATSSDLVNWTHQPIALYPDSLGYIFSGSAVEDVNNTSGFGKNGQVPLVAIFTHHDTVGEGSGKNDFQNQSIAYSLDEGKTWTKYAGNPVVRNPGIRDFRDPKVSWHQPSGKWIMTLATLDRITFYSSPDLKSWTRESEFGKDLGAHGGVWECPDLFPLSMNDDTVWVLIVSINPGGPNGGSATQYFLGDFNGKDFTPADTLTRWLDFGPDNYAGITWENTGSRKIFIGWMNNWQYANRIPTSTWRGAATLPRDLQLKEVNGKYYVASQPSPELQKLVTDNTNTTLPIAGGNIQLPLRVDFSVNKDSAFKVRVANDRGEEVTIGFEPTQRQYYIDRTRSGIVDFEKGFAARHVAPRIAGDDEINVTLFLDQSSVELFADDGLTVMTSQYFPNESFTRLAAEGVSNINIRNLKPVF
jgi:fructan beta-fructosidase